MSIFDLNEDCFSIILEKLEQLRNVIKKIKLWYNVDPDTGELVPYNDDTQKNLEHNYTNFSRFRYYRVFKVNKIRIPEYNATVHFRIDNKHEHKPEQKIRNQSLSNQPYKFGKGFRSVVRMCPCKKCSIGQTKTYIKLYNGHNGWKLEEYYKIYCSKEKQPDLFREIKITHPEVGNYRCHFIKEMDRVNLETLDKLRCSSNKSV